MRDVRGKVVVVTGAASGLGRAIALRFATAGARIVALDRDREQLDAFDKELGAIGAERLALPLDVTDASACGAAFAAAVARFGSIDTLVNNAGISHRSAFDATALEVIRRVVEVNFFGAVNCTHAALPHLIKSRGVSRGPRAKLAEIPNVGHAPLFLVADQIAIAREFLLAP